LAPLTNERREIHALLSVLTFHSVVERTALIVG
jgi:hypothetical protein